MNLDHLKNKIAIVGVGYTPQGKVPGRTAISFHCEAVANAIADAGISKNEIDALYAYRHFDALAGDFDLTGYALAEQLGIARRSSARSISAREAGSMRPSAF